MAPDACSWWDNSACEGTEHCPPRCPRFVDGEGVPVLIRPYQSDRYDALVAMYEDIEETTMGVPPTKRSALETWLDGLTSDGWNLLATRDDAVVGHVAVVPPDAPDPEFVIFVHPAFQDRGIGTELLEHVVAHAGDRDHDELTLNVSKDRHRAIAVYEKIGFSVTNVTHLEMEMRLALDESLVAAVQQPPAARNG